MPVFHACVKEAQAAHVMCSYNAINGVPACANGPLLNGVLRDQWQWSGFVVSDYDAWAQIYETHAFCPNLTCAAAAGLNAGLDQEGGGTRAIEQIPEALENGWVSDDVINEAFRRLFRVRIRLGMHDPPTMVVWNQLKNTTIVENMPHLELARYAAQQAICLYKNKGDVLPLATDKIAIIGPGAIQDKLLLGNYAVMPDSGIFTVQEAIEEAVNKRMWESGDFQVDKLFDGLARRRPKVKLPYAVGCATIECNSTSGFEEAVAVAKGVDAIVVVLGLDQQQEREGHDRDVIELPGNQTKLVSTLRKAYPSTPLIVVLIHGGTLGLGTVVDDADAILDAWYPGMMGGYAISDVIFGAHNPSGRVPVTYYSSTSELPAPGTTNLYPSNSSKGLTYRYYNGTPVFPFGYGLSYTTFEYSKLQVNTTTPSACDHIGLNVTVTNTGKRDGSEVIQVYAKQPEASVDVPRVRIRDVEQSLGKKFTFSRPEE